MYVNSDSTHPSNLSHSHKYSLCIGKWMKGKMRSAIDRVEKSFYVVVVNKYKIQL